jgi:hypothetical protein
MEKSSSTTGSQVAAAGGPAKKNHIFKIIILGDCA